jgi:hypothetical protein
MANEQNFNNDAYGILDDIGEGINDIIDSSLDWATGLLDEGGANEMPVDQAVVDANANLVDQGRMEEAALGLPEESIPSNLASPEEEEAWRQEEVERLSGLPATQEPVNQADVYAQRDQNPNPLADQTMIPQMEQPTGALGQVAAAPTNGALPVDKTQLMPPLEGDNAVAADIPPSGVAPVYGQPGGKPFEPEVQEGGFQPSDEDANEFAKTIPDHPDADMSGDMLMDKINSLGKMFEERMNDVQKVKYNELSTEQHSRVALRFFLSLMERGGKRGSPSFLSNVGAAGRDALDARRVINEENNKNEESRYKRESKLAYDKTNLELGTFKHLADQARWKAQLARIKGGKEKVTYEKWKKMTPAEQNKWAEWKNAGKSGSDKVSFETYEGYSPARQKKYSEWKQAGNKVTGKAPIDKSITENQLQELARNIMKDANEPDQDGELPAKLMTRSQAMEEAKKQVAQGRAPIRRSRMEKLPAEGRKEMLKLKKEIDGEIKTVQGWKDVPSMAPQIEEAMEVIHKEWGNRRDEILKKYTN